MPGSNKHTIRDVGGWDYLGWRRYRRYCDAFDHVERAIRQGSYLDAIAVLESVIWDRLASRLGYLKDVHVPISKSIGNICAELVGSKHSEELGTDTGQGCEKDDAFRRVVTNLQVWVNARNKAVHQIAKVFRNKSVEDNFESIYGSNEHIAKEGKLLLREFDELDTADRLKNGRIPATSRNAFFPERGSRLPPPSEGSSARLGDGQRDRENT